MAGRNTVDLTLYRNENFDAKPEAKGRTAVAAKVAMPAMVKANPSARAVWKILTEWLKSRDMLDSCDVYSLGLTCMQWAEFVALSADIKKNGRTYKTEGRHGVQYKTRPEVAQRNDLERRLRSSFGEHGLTPLARVRLRAPEQGDLFGEMMSRLGEG